MIPRNLWANPLAPLLIIAILAGGGGVAYGLANLIPQLIAIIVLAVNFAALRQFIHRAPAPILWLMGASCLLPILMLVPIPFDLWVTLPGRQIAGEALISLGLDGWRPASLDPGRTGVAAVGLLVPVTLIIMGYHAPHQALINIAWGVVALGVINFLLGIPQLLSNGQFGLLYPENPMPGILFGTFANRNSTGIFLIACLILAALLPRFSLPKFSTQNGFAIIRIITIILLALAIILTQSRSAIALMAVPFTLIAIRCFTKYHGRLSVTWNARRRVIMPLGAIVAVVSVTAISTLPDTRAGQAMGRFAELEDARAYIWEDSVHSARRYWPLGAGPGTFDEVFQADESLENLTQRKAGRAHNDYLEIAVEAGLPGLLLIAAWLLAIGWLAIQARHSPDRWAAWAGGAILFCVAAQSLVDYPLRNQAMLAVAAFAFLLLLRLGARVDGP